MYSGLSDPFLDQSIGLTVTQLVEMFRQPRGGVLPRKDFDCEILGYGAEVLFPDENLPPSLIGSTVDYLTRYMIDGKGESAFSIPIVGAIMRRNKKKANSILKCIVGLDRRSIIYALMLTAYDVCYRAGKEFFVPVDECEPNEATIQNIKTMVERSLDFFHKYAGPVIRYGFDFKGGYTKNVKRGDGDFLTAEGIWDLKTSRREFTKDHSLQLLVYWRMGVHSIYPEFKDVKCLGIFNPRMNRSYKIDVSAIPAEIIEIIDKGLIGYTDVP